MSTSVGIDDLNVYGSTLSVAGVEIARARKKSDESVTGIGIETRSLPPAFEDPVTLAANAAKPLLAGDPIELLLVATESGVDFAKPLSSYLQKYLGLPGNCRHVEMKHACYAGTAALQLAASWVREQPKRRALVVMTDMARRLFGDSAEAAEGAGAVAFTVSASPRVLALEPHYGVATREIYDVMRPTPAKEVIHSSLSLAAYLDLFEEAWAAYAKAVGPAAFSRLDRFAFHTPVGPLVQQAHTVLLETCLEDADRAAIKQHFEEKVSQALRYPRALGNTYSACLYAALASQIDAGAQGTMGLYSYGSGSCAEFFSGVVDPRAAATVGRHGIAAHLAERRAVDVALYERLVDAHERGQTQAEFTPDREMVPGLFEQAYRGRGRLVLTSVRDYYRAYEWI